MIFGEKRNSGTKLDAYICTVNKMFHLKSIVYGNLDSQSDLENYVTQKLNETNIGPLGFGGKTTVLGSFVNVGNQRASGVRIVSVRPSCFVEPRVATLHL